MRSPTALTFASVDIMISNLTPAPSFRPSTTSQIQRFQVFTCRINAREKEYRFQLTASVHSRPDHVNSVTRFSVEESYRRGWDHNRQLCILRIGGSSTMTMGCRPGIVRGICQHFLKIYMHCIKQPSSNNLKQGMNQKGAHQSKDRFFSFTTLS